MIGRGGIEEAGFFFLWKLSALPSSPALSFSSHNRCLPGSTVWVVMTACLPNESIFLLLMLCIYTHCNLPYKPQRREERERARERGRGGKEGERDRDRASEWEREREEEERERKTERNRERKAQTKPSYQTADSPPSPIQEKATRLMQQQVQYCQTNRVKKVYSLYHYCLQINSLRAAGSTFFIYAPLWGMYCFSSGTQYM